MKLFGKEMFRRAVDAGEHRMLKSGVCTQASLQSETFQRWVGELGERPGHMHRKVWEWCFITQALYERKLLTPGVAGLGFAVGQEPLASYFCSRGARICATDLFDDAAVEKGWSESNQHASGLVAVNQRRLCPQDQFRGNCTFLHVDMNAIPDGLVGYDFVWSSCSLEHLGSLGRGEAFIFNAMNCLKPGGFAVHTTEYNVSSNDATLSEGDTVLYRRRDIDAIAGGLRKLGHQIDIDMSLGKMPLDDVVDVPPYKHDPHLKLELGKFVITSVGLIIQKAG